MPHDNKAWRRGVGDVTISFTEEGKRLLRLDEEMILRYANGPLLVALCLALFFFAFWGDVFSFLKMGFIYGCVLFWFCNLFLLLGGVIFRQISGGFAHGDLRELSTW